MAKRYDIIINGGGIVGFTLLNLLKKSPNLCKARVLLIDQASRPPTLHSNNTDTHREKFSNRVSSIIPSSRQVFENLNIWKDLSPFAKSIKSIKVWNYDYGKSMIFENSDTAMKAQYHTMSMFDVIENNRMLTALVKNIHDNSHDDSVLWNHSLYRIEPSPDKSKRLSLVVSNNKSDNGDQSLEAPLIIGCDGYQSKVRELAKFPYKESDLSKSALVGTIRMVRDDMNVHNEIAYQRFSTKKDTVAAILPLSETHSSFVISGPNNFCKHLLSCSDSQFVDEFNQLLAGVERPELIPRTLDMFAANKIILGMLGGRSSQSARPQEPPKVESVVPNSRATFKLIQGRALVIVGSLPGNFQVQIALVGDSAHRVHPLAGQGLNLGIQDAQTLTLVLEDALSSGQDLFNPNNISELSVALRNYEKARLRYVSLMMDAIVNMPLLFKLVGPNLLSASNQLAGLKKFFVNHARGPQNYR